MDTEILTPRQFEKMLGLPNGRAAKLAQAGRVPHVVLPSVSKQPPELRFLRSVISEWLRSGCPAVASGEVATAGAAVEA